MPQPDSNHSRSDFNSSRSSHARDLKPVFSINLQLSLNVMAAEQLVDYLEKASHSNRMTPEVFAIFKQLESWVGEKE